MDPVSSNQVINSISSTTSCDVPVPYPKNLPGEVLLRNRDHYKNICIPLYKASMRGDWKAAEAIVKKHHHLDLGECAINENYDTLLHIAAYCKGSNTLESFVNYLLHYMRTEHLEFRNRNGNTAFCLAVLGGNVKAVTAMLEKNKALLDIPGRNETMPVYMASLSGNGEMVKFVYDKSIDMSRVPLTTENRSLIIQNCVESNIYDLPLEIVLQWPDLAINGHLLRLLARKTGAFRKAIPPWIGLINQLGYYVCLLVHTPFPAEQSSGDALKLLKLVLEETMKLDKDKLRDIIQGPSETATTRENSKEHDEQLLVNLPVKHLTLRKGIPEEETKVRKLKYPSRVLFVAAQMGNTEFIVEFISKYPDLIWHVNDDNHSIFHVAVTYRHADIYMLLHEIGSIKEMITSLVDEEGNTMLHLVGKFAKGEYLISDLRIGVQMQLEISWFKKVQDMLPPSYRNMRNNGGLTPIQLFVEEHKDLLSANSKLMKSTANQCLFVAALIASVAFAVAFQVPGGYNQETGIPLFLNNKAFIVFAIADAISLASSSTSILIFLSVFMSQESGVDYVENLPLTLMSGLVALFCSVIIMLFGFTVSFFAIYHDNLIWVPIIIAVLVSLPIINFSRNQYLLMSEAHKLLASNRLDFKKKAPRLFYKNPRF